MVYQDYIENNSGLKPVSNYTLGPAAEAGEAGVTLNQVI